ncbi:fatty acid desaturase [Rugosibacter aromaticivorans]|uniref:fatty acid desaturase n=1 Tax=Rugosibacter aromaticivorans TaxID=1565605 RepID=UPI000ADA62AF|nr:fatty acid desaturase [Rugosibacter aromaticivorans]
MLIEWVRCLAPSFLVVLAAAGIALGGIWVWAGFVGVLILVLADGFSQTDIVIHTRFPAWFYTAALYLPLPVLCFLWFVFAQQIAADVATTSQRLVTLGSVAFLTTLGALPAAHELSHRKNRIAQLCARIYSTILGLPMYDIYHIHGHHIDVGTVQDHDTPRRGQTIYSFVYPSLYKSLRTAVGIERARLAKLGHRIFWWRGRIFESFWMLTAWFSGFIYFAGLRGIPYFLMTWLLAWLIFGGFNYTQHYGLIRKPGTAIAPRHSWNHLKAFSRAITFEISNHSEHHLDPDKRYEYLRPVPNAPQMPSIVLCFAASFVPFIWENWIVKSRLKYWDLNAEPEEQVLAVVENRRAGWQ